MGQLALAAKITHVPSMYLSELPGPRHGTRQDAIAGHQDISRRCRALGVDTLVVFDTHWLVNANYHLNCAPHFKGQYTSNELPHFISNMGFESPGNPALGHLLARVCNEHGVETLAHDATTLAPEYGTLVPLRYMNPDQHFKVVSVSALCMAHYLNDSARLGWAMRQAVEQHYDGRVAFWPAALSATASHKTVWHLSSLSKFGVRCWKSSTPKSSACGKTASGPRFARCCPSTPARATAKVSCMTRPCCWALWVGRAMTARPRSSRLTLARRAPGKSTPCFP